MDSLPFFVFLSVPFWVVFVRAEECNLTGECIDSDVVAEYYTDTEKDCLKACKETTNCAWFTFVESADFCSLFSECHVFLLYFWRSDLSGYRLRIDWDL